MNFDWMRGRLRAGVLAGLLGGAVLSAAAATKVAVIVPLSGGLAAAGKEIESTSRAWAAQINAKAGTGSVDLLVLDDKSSADGARAAARRRHAGLRRTRWRRAGTRPPCRSTWRRRRPWRH